jgi:predicted DCC family thiol-disulfide oxidoreductase YuxK
MADAATPYSYRQDALVPLFPDDKPIIVFDGICVLCSSWVNFVLRHDTQAKFRLLSAQSALGQALYRHYGMSQTEFETNILIENGRPWYRLDGSIRMAQGLGFPWSFVVIARLLPQSVKDGLYKLIASNRYKWFGRRDTCYLPDARFQDRFLDQIPP